MTGLIAHNQMLKKKIMIITWVSKEIMNTNMASSENVHTLKSNTPLPPPPAPLPLRPPPPLFVVVIERSR